MTPDERRREQVWNSKTRRMPGHLLRRCQQIAVSIFLQECREIDLTPLQFVVLCALDDLEGLDQATLGGITALDRTTVGVVIEKLESRGLVARRRSEADRRSNLITCTDTGRALRAEARPAVELAQRRILAPLSLAEQEQLLGLLERIADDNNSESRAPMKI